MVSVVVVDDQEPFRRAAREVVAATPGFELLAEAISGEEGVALAKSLEPDLVLMDIKMPGIGGIEAARRIAARRAGTLILLVSSYREGDLPADARLCGATYIHKERFGRRVLEQIWNGGRGASPADRTGRPGPP